MAFQSLLLLLTTSVALANCGLLGQITYANNPGYAFANGASKVSYNSVAQPQVSSFGGQYHSGQQLQYQFAQPQQSRVTYQTGYTNYPTGQAQISQSAGLVQHQGFTSYQQPARVQVTRAQPLYYSPADDGSFSYVTSVGGSYSQGSVANLQQPRQQQFVSVPQRLQAPLVPVQRPHQQQQHQHFQSVQPLNAPLLQIQPPRSVPVPVAPVSKPVQVNLNYLPAPKPVPVNQAYLPVPNVAQSQVKNAHHYPTLVAGQQLQTLQNQQRFVTSFRTPAFRSAFSGQHQQQSAAVPVAPAVTPLTTSSTATSHRVLHSGPHFSQTVVPSGATTLRSSPIGVPSSALIAPLNHSQQQVQQVQQHVRQFSPSTSVSHASFEGMGVKYQW